MWQRYKAFSKCSMYSKPLQVLSSDTRHSHIDMHSWHFISDHKHETFSWSCSIDVVVKQCTLTMCLDEEIWSERKVRDLKGFKIPSYDNKKEGEGFEGKTLKIFVKNTISPKVERFEKKTLVYLPFPSPFLLNKQDALCLLTPPLISLPFLPLPFLFFSPNFIYKHSVKLFRYSISNTHHSHIDMHSWHFILDHKREKISWSSKVYYLST